MVEGVVAPVKEGDVLASRYRVERVLASGGMGVVVAAKHVTLGQRVALKFLLSNIPATSEVAARFEREARAAALLKSEHVARVIDVGTLEDGAPYMVMEYLDGCDLATLIETEGRLSIDVAVDYVLQACEGLAEAHAARIVHRDLKPSNLFRISRPDGSPLIKILDFGISKVDDTTSAAVTSTATVLGSPLYMSPEQMQSSKGVDSRTDIWSLGILLYQLMTRRLPFEEETLPGLYVAVATKPPQPLRQALPHAPAELEAVLIRCLQKTPQARYQNVAELAAALAPFCNNSGAQVERIRRVLGAPSASPDASQSHIRISGAGPATAQTDPFGPTKTALAESLGTMNVPRKRSNLPFIAGAAALALAAGIALTIVKFSSDPKPTVLAATSVVVPASSVAATTPPTVSTTTPNATSTAEPSISISTTTSTKPAVAAHTATAHASTKATPSATPTAAQLGFSSDRK